VTRFCQKKANLLIPDQRDVARAVQTFHMLKFSILFLEQQSHWHLIAFLMMPNHIRLVVRPAEKKDLARTVDHMCISVERAYHNRYRNISRLWERDVHIVPMQQRSQIDKYIRYLADAPHAEDDRGQWPYLMIREIN
jgi:hypothetical protein